jgi:dolichol-phosphate mannosyltransferase
LIVPVFNEEAVLGPFRERVVPILDRVVNSFEILLVNDGSTDQSEQIIDGYAAEDSRIRCIHFSRNFGHQAAVTAGLHYASGECAVIIDADLQDPPEVIEELVAKFREGFAVVYAQRRKRAGEARIKRWTAFVFYRTLAKVSDVQIPVDTGDFCLLDRKVIDILNSMPERNRYLRGLRAWVGFPQAAVPFDRRQRFAGETKYPFRRMLQLALNGIFSLSKAPLRLATYLGLAVSFFAFIYGIVIIIQKLTHTGPETHGWASTIVVALFLGGVQLICVGVIGEFIGRIYDEVKQRPFYIIARKSDG